MKSAHPGVNSSSYLACVTDPWHAPPAQLPDEFQGPTIPLKLKQTTTVAGTATGTNALLIVPSVSSFTYPSTVTAGGVVTWGATAPHDDYTDFLANFDEYRFISIGVKVVYIGQADLASGQVVVYPFLSKTVGNSAGIIPANINDWRDNQSASVHSVSIDQKSPVCAMHSYDRPPFTSIGSSTCVTVFPQLAIGFIGIPTALVPQFAVELTINVEAVPKQGSIHHGLAQASPDHPHVIDLARKLTPTITAVGEADAKSQQNKKLSGAKRSPGGSIRRKTAGQKWKTSLRYPRSAYAVPRNKFATSTSRYSSRGSRAPRRRTMGPRMRRFR